MQESVPARSHLHTAYLGGHLSSAELDLFSQELIRNWFLSTLWNKHKSEVLAQQYVLETLAESCPPLKLVPVQSLTHGVGVPGQSNNSPWPSPVPLWEAVLPVHPGLAKCFCRITLIAGTVRCVFVTCSTQFLAFHSWSGLSCGFSKVLFNSLVTTAVPGKWQSVTKRSVHTGGDTGCQHQWQPSNQLSCLQLSLATCFSVNTHLFFCCCRVNRIWNHLCKCKRGFSLGQESC